MRSSALNMAGGDNYAAKRCSARSWGRSDYSTAASADQATPAGQGRTVALYTPVPVASGRSHRPSPARARSSKGARTRGTAGRGRKICDAARRSQAEHQVGLHPRYADAVGEEGKRQRPGEAVRALHPGRQIQRLRSSRRRNTAPAPARRCRAILPANKLRVRARRRCLSAQRKEGVDRSSGRAGKRCPW